MTKKLSSNVPMSVEPGSEGATSASQRSRGGVCDVGRAASGGGFDTAVVALMCLVCLATLEVSWLGVSERERRVLWEFTSSLLSAHRDEQRFFAASNVPRCLLVLRRCVNARAESRNVHK